MLLRKRENHESRRLNENNNLVPGLDLWNQLDDATIESVLARLPTIDIIRCQSVCKRWRSLVKSPTFQRTSHELFNRGAWFFMVNSQSPANVVYDLEIKNWRHVRLPVPINFNGTPRTPVASSDGLMCFSSKTGRLIVCNPITGSARSLPRLDINLNIKAIAMHAMGSSFKVFVIFGRLHDLVMATFSSMDNAYWTMRPVSSIRMIANNANAKTFFEHVPQRNLYINVQWKPMKELAGVTMVDRDDKMMVYYLSQEGRLMRYDSLHGTAMIYPHLMPFRVEDGIDLVKCADRILVVRVLREPNATLGIWEFDHAMCQWRQVATMPPEMFRVYPGLSKTTCVGHDNRVVCVTSSDITHVYRVVMYNISEDTWVDLPMCFALHGEHAERFVASYSFKPDINANI